MCQHNKTCARTIEIIEIPFNILMSKTEGLVYLIGAMHLDHDMKNIDDLKSLNNCIFRNVYNIMKSLSKNRNIIKG